MTLPQPFEYTYHHRPCKLLAARTAAILVPPFQHNVQVNNRFYFPSACLSHEWPLGPVPTNRPSRPLLRAHYSRTCLRPTYLPGLPSNPNLNDYPSLLLLNTQYSIAKARSKYLESVIFKQVRLRLVYNPVSITGLESKQRPFSI